MSVRIQDRREEWEGNQKEKQRTRAAGRTRDEESFQLDMFLIQANPSTRTLLCLYRFTSWAGYTTHATRLSLDPLSTSDAAVGRTSSEPMTRKPSSWQIRVANIPPPTEPASTKAGDLGKQRFMSSRFSQVANSTGRSDHLTSTSV
jgi:hypothetical protein